MNETDSKRRSLLASGLPVKIGAVFAIALCLLIAWSIYLVRDKLLMNANDMGSSLAASYAAEEENRTSMYSLLMSMVASSLNHALANGETAQAYENLLEQYDTNIEDSLGVNIIDPYAVIDGHLVAAYPWEGDPNCDYASSPWYTEALAADGHVIFTDAYTDAITGEELITLAVKLNGEGNVLAFDILLENYHAHRNKASLPQGSSYFLYDESGSLIYTASGTDVDEGQAASWAESLRSSVLEGRLEGHLSTITDPNGVTNGVYYSEMSNGWLSVITIPIKDILQDGWDTAIVSLAAICLVLFVLVVAIMIRGYLDSRKMQHTEDTLKILGDTFYAIYRIDYDAGTYETIKSSPDVREGLGQSGSYDHMLTMVGNVVEKRTFDAFEQSFSLENIRKLAAEGIEEFGGDYRRRFPDGYKWVNIRLIYNRDLGLNEVAMCFREVDAEKRQQLQQQALLESALDSARQTVDKKSAFFSNVSHDMRTPLNAVIGLSSLARTNLDDREKVEDYLTKIEQAGSQLLTLVNDVLDMSRIEHGKETELAYVPCDLAQCVNDGAALFKEAAERDGKTLNVQTEADIPVVMCDPARIGQILNNLVSNAVKYSMPGDTVSVKLDVVSRRPKMCKCRIVVADTGIGMSQNFLEHIFEPFARETTFSPVKVSGTGLGMPIVKSLVQQMSGEISVNSELGAGSTFTVVLPLRIAEENELAGAKAEEASGDAPDFNLEGKRLLVAEDNEINMEIMQEMLGAMGAEVIPAMNGREAVGAFEATDPGYIDVILMDMQMPEMDGCEACRAIRALERSDAKTVPVIAVTANAFAEDIARTTEAGMNAHVSKPIDFNVLLSVLAKVCDK